MPPLPAVPSVLQTDMHFLIGTDAGALCRLHWTYSGSAPTVSQCQQMGDLMAGAFEVTAGLRSVMHSSNQYTKTITTDLASSTGAQGENDNIIAGSLSGSPLPASTCVLINHHVGRRYRGGKPRTYLPLGDNTKLASPSIWASGFPAACTTAWLNFVTAVLAGEAGAPTITGLVNVSYYHGFTVVTNPTTGRARNRPTLRAGGPVVDPITASQANPIPATQRRRNRP